MTASLEDDWDAVIKSFRQTARNNDLRLIRRNDYRFVTTTEKHEIERFYDDIYVPFTRTRHESHSIVAPRKHVIRRAMQGKLLQVLKGDELVAAGVVYPEDEVLYFLWMGLPTGFRDGKPEAAISALYYFGIRYAWDHGCFAVDFTGTRAFLTDGGYRFKRKWGAAVEDTFSPSSTLIKPLKGSPAAAIFCEHLPLIVRSDLGLEAILLSHERIEDRKHILSLGKEFGCQGLDRFSVIDLSAGNDASDSIQSFYDGGLEYRHVRTSFERFTAHYSRRGLSARGIAIED
jgi:hypothetical protein